MADEPKVAENKPKTYRGVLAKAHFRCLFLKVVSAKAANRVQDRWLTAASAELEDPAEVDICAGATVKMKHQEDADCPVEREFSSDAIRGIRFAVVQAAVSPQTPFLERRDLLKACEGFGSKFRAQVEVDSRLPESKDLDEEKELEI